MIVLPMPGCERLGRLARELHGAIGAVEVHRFPDGEGRVRLSGPVEGEDVVLVAGLDRPDDKVLPLLFAAATARDLGATSVGLVAPYLPYLRQDRRFQAGEGISARYFARLLSQAVDWLVTVDPHLHRIGTLAELFSVPAEALHAAPLLAGWIRRHVEKPLVLGPDAEKHPVGRLHRAPGGRPARRLRQAAGRGPQRRDYAPRLGRARGPPPRPGG